MKICPKCGKSSESKFCPECGCDLTNITEENVNVIENAIDADVEVVDDSTDNESVDTDETELQNNNVETATDPSEPLYLEKEEFHKKTWFIILMLILFFPVGVFFMWKHKKFKKAIRIILSVILGLNFVFWALIFAVILAPCDHEWTDATCESPKICAICGDTEGEALGHDDGEWTLTEEATLVDVGVEELLCTRCNESLDSRGTECKDAEAEGKTFNFTDEELIAWIEDFSTAEIGSEDLDILEGNNTSYRITTTDGEVGALLLNHSHGDEVSGIMVYFEDYQIASALAVLIGEKIDSDFDSEDALYKLVLDKSYTSSNMTVVRLEMDEDFEVTLLAPNDFLDEILD